MTKRWRIASGAITLGTFVFCNSRVAAQEIKVLSSPKDDMHEFTEALNALSREMKEERTSIRYEPALWFILSRAHKDQIIPQYITERWEYDCRPNELKNWLSWPKREWSMYSAKTLNQILKIFFEETASDGISRIRDINPELSEAILEKLGKIKIKVICKKLPLNSHALAGTMAKSNIFSELAGRPTTTYKMHAGRAVSNYLFWKQQEPELQSQIQSHQIVSTNQLHHRDTGIQVARNTLFHELLHSAGVDDEMMSWKVHDRYYFQQDNIRIRDIVFACAEQAFPNPVDPLSEKQLYVAQCETCARAQLSGRLGFKHGFLTVDPDSIAKANQSCKVHGAAQIQEALLNYTPDEGGCPSLS